MGKNGRMAHYLSKKRPKLKRILKVYTCGFRLCPLSEVILYRLVSFGGCPLFRVERCPLLGGSKYTISIGIAIGGMGFVRCTEVVRLSESPLLEVSLYNIIIEHNNVLCVSLYCLMYR